MSDDSGSSFDFSGTLVVADRPSEPAAAISTELAAEGIQTPADWSTVYRQRQTSVSDNCQLPLSEHVDLAPLLVALAIE